MRLLQFVLVSSFSFSLGIGLQAQEPAIVIEGVTERSVYVDRASFRVPAVAGSEDRIALNGVAMAADAWHELIRPDYYELQVLRTNKLTGFSTNRFVPFIIRASARGNSEWGLQPWTPFPIIHSSADEFDGAILDLIVPPALPAGMAIPVVALAKNARGEALRANGIVQAPGFPPLQIRRGFGSILLPTPVAAGPLLYNAHLHGLALLKSVHVESNTVWQTVSGELPARSEWPPNARVKVTAHLTIPDGATLVVGRGAVVQLAAGVEIRCAGALDIQGAKEVPVIFAPIDRAAPWGGLVLRSAAAVLNARGTIFTGGGADPNWFGTNPGSGSSHRSEQPLIYLQNGARATLDDCYLIDNAGQGGHGENGFLTMNRCLIQRVITAGQYNGGAVVATDSAFIEFPSANAPFADDDNDGLYLTGGSHSFTNCLIGWALDDGIDAGSGAGGSVRLQGCWLEACYHEALAWSESRFPETRDTVILNCGQGIESGFGAPQTIADHLLAAGNFVGARFGDNYNWTYNGFLRLTNSILIYNYRDVWGMTWDTWSERISQMDLTNNYWSSPHPAFPSNTLWSPSQHASLLLPFVSAPPGADVGVAFATRANVMDVNALTNVVFPFRSDSAASSLVRIPVGLSVFTTNQVEVGYRFSWASGVAGVVRFLPGQTIQEIAIPYQLIPSNSLARVELIESRGAQITQSPVLHLYRLDGDPGRLLFAFAAPELVLAWRSGWNLEAAETITGPWTLLAATPPFTVNTTSQQRYFRLRRP